MNAESLGKKRKETNCRTEIIAFIAYENEGDSSFSACFERWSMWMEITFISKNTKGSNGS